MAAQFHWETISPGADRSPRGVMCQAAEGLRVSRPGRTWLAVMLALAGLGVWLTPALQAQTAVPQPMPDFQLRDANSNSSRYTRMVSPRDYRLQISAYYFGDAG